MWFRGELVVVVVVIAMIAIIVSSDSLRERPLLQPDHLQAEARGGVFLRALLSTLQGKNQSTSPTRSESYQIKALIRIKNFITQDPLCPIFISVF